jgi:hypothetical protein
MNKFLIAAGIGAGLIIAQTAASAAADGLILSAPAEVAVATSASAGRAAAPMDRVSAGAASYDLALVDGLGTSQVPGQQSGQQDVLGFPSAIPTVTPELDEAEAETSPPPRPPGRPGFLPRKPCPGDRDAADECVDGKLVLVATAAALAFAAAQNDSMKSGS